MTPLTTGRRTTVVAYADRIADDEPDGSEDLPDVDPPIEPGWLVIEPPGSRRGPEGWVQLGWPNRAGLATAMCRNGNAIEVRSSELVISALPADLEQRERPDSVRVFVSSFVLWQPEQERSDQKVLPMPAAIILDTGDDEVRLSLGSAHALAVAVLSLIGAVDRPLVPDLAERGWTREQQLCPATVTG